jgi:hypothetical protein
MDAEQAFWSGLVSSQTGDGIDRLDALFAAHDTLAGQAADLGIAAGYIFGEAVLLSVHHP